MLERLAMNLTPTHPVPATGGAGFPPCPPHVPTRGRGEGEREGEREGDQEEIVNVLPRQLHQQ